MNNKIEIIQGDITKIEVDVIVNAANSSLLGGSGVDGKIHRAGGKNILDECQKIRSRQGGCRVGEAVITTAGNLPAEYVIHTVGPRWNGGNSNECQLLKSCYFKCFCLVDENKSKIISFPSISTGTYGFPKEMAAKIALKSIEENLLKYPYIEKVKIICFDPDNYKIYREITDLRR